MPSLSVSNLAHNFDNAVLRDISFEVDQGSVCCLLGPSGCGKSTLLRLIAGLEKVQQGKIRYDGQVLSSQSKHVDPEHRSMGLLFQEYALFPHMNVFENIAFGLQKQSAKSVQSIVLANLESIGLAHKSKAFPHELSGGEKQRVALARTLAPSPKLLLLDEPFSSLDSVLKQKTREECWALLRARKTPVVFVTHDPEEAMAFSDWIVLLDKGVVAQQGNPRNLFETPVSPFVLSFLQPANEWHGVEHGKTLCVRPQHVEISDDKAAIGSEIYSGTVCQIQYLGTDNLVILNSGKWGPVRCRVPVQSLVNLHIGRRVTFAFTRKYIF